MVEVLSPKVGLVEGRIEAKASAPTRPDDEDINCRMCLLVAFVNFFQEKERKCFKINCIIKIYIYFIHSCVWCVFLGGFFTYKIRSTSFMNT